MLSIYMCLWLIIALVAGSILDSFKNVINATLGLTGYRTETIINKDENLEYFESKFVVKDDNGNIK